MALGLKFWLAPLRLIRAPVDEICMTLLLSLRFMSVVFDELRNLSLGLAARSVPWKQLPPGAGIQVGYLLHLTRLDSYALGFVGGFWRAAQLSLGLAARSVSRNKLPLGAGLEVIYPARLHHALLSSWPHCTL